MWKWLVIIVIGAFTNKEEVQAIKDEMRTGLRKG